MPAPLAVPLGPQGPGQPPYPAPEPTQWLARYGSELYRYALARVGGADAAEELVQATLLRALQALGNFRGEASERTWLFAILKRQVLDYYRRQAHHPEVSLAELAPEGPTEADFFEEGNGHWRAAQAPTSWQTADGALEQAELQATLHRCQQRLPTRHAAVFALRFVEELPAEEICQALSLSAANYWVIIHRAKLQLRRCLEQHGLGRRAGA
ncbi:sigma-70 family RNA polymerase sigma factor [Hymenobacter nivis]|uniref:RNA polymerase sigma factor n=1 Tax=Hymenobacter nivis TaxID=1850093 RepID=A0A502HG06_9BACT|nr:sigma-70 family RNA polymerase sigma factor [Hymenobacter nivis]TPG72188.1 sigma-70 family RNA polymerase sigma factor [Hymenobacter nivis]